MALGWSLTTYPDWENQDSGLPLGVVSMTEDKRGNIWLINASQMAYLNPTTGAVVPFQGSDLLFRDIKSLGELSSILIDNQNRLWIGGRNGIVMYNLSGSSHE